MPGEKRSILHRKPHKFEASGEFFEHLDGEERRRSVPPEIIVERMGLSENDSVLDLGAGVGYFAMPISKGSRDVIAIDSEPKMLSTLSQRTRSSGIVNMHLVCGDIAVLPFADGSVDHVLAAFVYHEVSDQSKLMEESARVLRPSGKLTVVDFQKRISREGPPIWVRKSPLHVERTSSPWFRPFNRFETDLYYQLCFVRS
jgi:ubiquinone/menaquinone biosynthesis C-methylase UbiE